MEFELIEVRTRDEYRDAQEPICFEWKGGHYEIVQIVDRWYEGYMDARQVPLRYFRVRTREGKLFILRYHELFVAWSLMNPMKNEQD